MAGAATFDDAGFRKAYRALLRGVFGPPTQNEGFDEGAIDEVERKLGGFPGALRAVYEIAGRHRAMTKGHHLLLAPNGIRKRDGAWIFQRERQDVCSYGVRAVDFTKADPPVVQRTRDGALRDDCARLSSFLLKSLAWQAVFVSGEGGQGRTDAATLNRLRRELATIEWGPPIRYDVQCFYDKGVVVCAFAGAHRVDVYVASRDAAKARRLAKRFGLELDEF